MRTDTYGPPMAVASINQIRKVLEYAITEIPKEKILMGIPNYSYDWQLPFESGVSKATSIGNQFEDVRRIQANYNLFDEFNILGAGYWNVMHPFAQNWAFLSTQYSIKKFV